MSPEDESFDDLDLGIHKKHSQRITQSCYKPAKCLFLVTIVKALSRVFTKLFKTSCVSLEAIKLSRTCPW